MIREVHLRTRRSNDVPYSSSRDTDITAAIGLGAALDYLTNVGMEEVRAHERELIAYAREVLPREVPSIRIHGPLDPTALPASSPSTSRRPPHDVTTLLDREGSPSAPATIALCRCTSAWARSRARGQLQNLHRPRGHRPVAAAEQGRSDSSPGRPPRRPLAEFTPPKNNGRPVPATRPRAHTATPQLRPTWSNPPRSRKAPTAVWRPDHADARHRRRGNISDVAFTAEAARSASSASMLTDEIKGKPLTDIAKLGQQGRAGQPAIESAGADEGAMPLARHLRSAVGDRVTWQGRRMTT